MSSKYTDYARACNRCHAIAPARDLIHLLMRKYPYGSTKRIAYLCEDCAATMADELEAPIPDLDEVRRNAPMALCLSCFSFGSSRDRFCRWCGAPMGEKEDE